jgi:signal transduction histidine kinase
MREIRAAEGNGWAALADRLMRGVTHQLSNRAYALMTLAAELEESPDAQVIGLLKDEVLRLERTVRLMRTLEDPGGQQSPCSPETLVRDAAALFVLRAGRRIPEVGIRVEDGLPAQKSDAAAVMRALLLACELVAGDRLAVSISARRSGNRVRYLVERAEPDAAGVPMTPSEVALSALQPLADRCDGRVTWNGGSSVEMSYPLALEGGAD